MSAERQSLLQAHVEHVPPNLGFPDQWQIVNGDGSIITVRQSKTEAEAFADGYNIGVRHGQFSA